MAPSLRLAFRPGYFWLTVLMFAVEALIAAYVHDRFLRPYGGDFLVVILVYFFIRAFCALEVGPATGAALLIAYLVEIGQYYHLIRRLGWEHSRAAQLLLGVGFSWVDMLMYTLGALTILTLEHWRTRRHQRSV